MTTRGRKRKVGQRDLWDLIVNNDDICFKHILPRLNRTDLKFLHLVNNEARKLIKRSSREGELMQRFKVEEMSSISTLEVAWKNRKKKSLWPSSWGESYFCWQVAHTNKLELLKWAREEKQCEWNIWTINVAAEQGNLEMVKYCVANKCPIGRWVSVRCYIAAAKHGHLDCLKYLHETAKAPWNDWSVYHAHKNNHLDCVQYLLDNNCPLPSGWRYEGGALHTN
jgi:hypothetical protein